MNSPVLRWLEDYAAHLRAGAASFVDVGLSPEYLAACQEFDSALRALDGDRLRRAASTPEGARLVSELAAARTEFDEAVAAARGRLETEQNGVRNGARALRGYTEAGTRGGPSAKFLTRRG